MYKHIFLSILLIICALSVRAEDSVRVSAADLQALIQRIERLERKDSLSQQMGNNAANSQVDDSTRVQQKAAGQPRTRHGRFTIGGYGEITAKHCFYSNNYLRYGKNPEKYAGDHYGEFDLPHVVIYMGYDFGKGWSMGTEIEFEHGGTESAVEIEEEECGRSLG